MAAHDSRRTVSIVIETANIESDTLSFRDLCRLLVDEISETDGVLELLLVTGKDRTITEAIAVDSGLAHASCMRTLSGAGLGYYEMKNLGVRHAEGDIVAFVDSDTLPEPGWLSTLLAPLEDPQVEIVTGTTYEGPLEDTFTRSLALSGKFPLRSLDDSLYPHNHLWANNLAGRRELLLNHPFSSDNRRRGQCWSLAQELRRNGVTIWAASGARACHATLPRQGFLRFAYKSGYDQFETQRLEGGHAFRRWAVISGYFVKRAIQPLGPGRRRVGLRRRDIPAALGWSVVYNAALWFGATSALITAVGSRRDKGAGDPTEVAQTGGQLA
jgi:glycosyltransferase involved in cell wall biosynthesis